MMEERVSESACGLLPFQKCVNGIARVKDAVVLRLRGHDNEKSQNGYTASEHRRQRGWDGARR